MRTEQQYLNLERERDALAARLDRATNVISMVFEYVDEPPERNCSCHISPPCSDCVDYSGLRELFSAARTFNATPDDSAAILARRNAAIWLEAAEVADSMSTRAATADEVAEELRARAAELEKAQ